MKKFICRNCGVVNEADDAKLSSSGDWLECDLPTGFEWSLPAGKITPVIGDPIYISGHGEHLSQSEYLEKYNIDPEVAYKLIRGKARSLTPSQLVASQNQKTALESASRIKDANTSKGLTGNKVPKFLMVWQENQYQSTRQFLTRLWNCVNYLPSTTKK